MDSSIDHSQNTDDYDFDLIMAARDREQHDLSVRNRAYLQAISELAGELYLNTYTIAFQEEMRKKREAWCVCASALRE
ncbi:unnamed protein product [Phytomonas sp. Hart1]|nr:unnamed protein product [Phytomonas sp. Hart1]|eukprot:CCW66883.1 unnamed protein product [Phytomonas sp. isolate Hart1]